jgi:hypothetical protein
VKKKDATISTIYNTERHSSHGFSRGSPAEDLMITKTQFELLTQIKANDFITEGDVLLDEIIEAVQDLEKMNVLVGEWFGPLSSPPIMRWRLADGAHTLMQEYKKEHDSHELG